MDATAFAAPQQTESIVQELRTTTGQRVRISYDPTTDALTFHEMDWFADPLRSTGVPVKSAIARRGLSPTIVALEKRRGSATARDVDITGELPRLGP